jgi:hypothetical protein
LSRGFWSYAPGLSPLPFVAAWTAVFAPLVRSVRRLVCLVQNSLFLLNEVRPRALRKHINKPMSIQSFLRMLEVVDAIRNIRRDPYTEDVWVWQWEYKSEFSSRSVYRAYFSGSTRSESDMAIWQTWAPLKYKVCKVVIPSGQILDR